MTTRRFVGHTNDVLSVSFSADNRQIVSGSRDRTIKLWNTLGDCKFTITDKGHTEWVSCVRFSPNPQNPVIVSAGWDKLVKVRLLLFTKGEHGQRMLCNLQVFATSELSSNETNNHQCTDDNNQRKGLELPRLVAFGNVFADSVLLFRSGNSPRAASKPTTSATPVTSTP